MYDTKVWINDTLVGSHKNLEDSFINAGVSVSWWDRFKSLFVKNWTVRVVLWADPETVKRTMNMDRADWSAVFVEHSVEGEAVTKGA